MAGTIFSQKHFRWYADDHAIGAGENPLANQDANPANLVAGVNYRLRIEVANSGDGRNIAGRLEFMDVAIGIWGAIQAAGNGNVFYTDSSYFNDGDPTTASLLTAEGTYSAGQAKDAGATSSNVMLNINGYREWEWNIQFAPEAVGNTYQFRVTNAGTLLTTYAVTPQVTVQSSFQAGSAVVARRRRQGE
jgi:hypothetical protein